MLALASSACGARLMNLPQPGAPATDIAQVVAEATRTCGTASSITAEAAVSGSVDGRRLRARLLVGLAAPASARLEAFALGQQIFILVAQGHDATLLLTRENRILQHGNAADVLEVVAGIPVDADQLRTTMLGCIDAQAATDVRAAAAAVVARQAGSDWRLLTVNQSEFYFRRESATTPWRLVAAVRRDSNGNAWRAEYRDFRSDLPLSVRLVSTSARVDRLSPRRFDLRLLLADVELNAKLPAAAFEVRIPPAAEPITIEELRRSGPLPTE
jgi:hypothetical protein